MTATRTRLPRGAFALAVLATAMAALALIVRAGSSAGPSAGEQAAKHFLDRYVGLSGRVVRRDQGGDTVSEGQGYAMLLSAAAGDRRRFERVWSWTRTHLQRPDGLFSYLWRGGRVADPQSASDADIDIAHALVLGADRFGRPGLRSDAARIGRAVLEHETVRAGGRLVLVAGPWATQGQQLVNPSYFSPRGFTALARATGDPRFGELESSSVAILRSLAGPARHLPPDWAALSGDGSVHPASGPSGQPPKFGYDAVRVPIRLSAAQARPPRALAANWWPSLRATGLSAGAPKLAAAAASARAAGHSKVSDELLDRATNFDRRYPTYYGAALIALTRVMGG